MARKAKKDNIDEFMDDYFRRVRFESPQKQPEDINNASMDKDANSSTAATGNSMNGNVNGTTYCTPSMYEQMYNNGLLGSFPYAGINPIINNGYLVTKRIQDTFSAVYSAKSFLDNFYTGNSDISPNDIVGNIFIIIVDQGAYFELRAHQVTRSTIICIKVEPSDNNIHSLIIRIPPVSDINNMLAYASAIVTEDTCGSVTDTPLKEEYAMRIFKAFTDMGIGESNNSLSQDISK